MDTIVPGALAAFVVDCSIFPLDTIKSRVQAEDFKERFPNRQGLYKGLWQGFGPVVLATLPSAALFFTTYENAKVYLTSSSTPIIGSYVASDPRAVALGHTAASAIAELAACLILTPAETIKQQMQVATTARKRVASNFSFASMHRSYWALAGRNLPFTAMQFPLYEFFRERLARRVGLPSRKEGALLRARQHSEPKTSDDVVFGDQARKQAYQTVHRSAATHVSQDAPPYMHYVKAGLVSGASAATAGAISALATTPLDLIKTRVMLQSASQRTAQPTMRAITVDIWKREGPLGLMKGGLLRCAWTALGAGIYLGAYESGREWWNDAGKDQVRDVVDQAEDAIQDVKSRTL